MVKTKDDLQFGNQLVEILDVYTENAFSEGEPLDSDAVEDLSTLLHAQLLSLNGCITDKEYETALQKREFSIADKKNSVIFLAVPVTTTNSANVSLMIIRVNTQLKETITKWLNTLVMLDSKVNLVVSDLDLEWNTILLSNETITQDNKKLNEAIFKIKQNYNANDVSDITEYITDDDFNALYDDTNYNWNDDIKFSFTRQGFYINDHFETDVIESFGINYNEVE